MTDARRPRRSGDRAAVLLALILVAVGSLGWWLYLRPELRSDLSGLRALPPELGSWRSRDLPMDAAVESMLDADLSVQRVYLHPFGEIIWLYLGYYGTTRGGSPEHLPSTCYQSQGWQITSRRRIAIDARTGLRANEYVVQREGETRLVHFWYRSHRGTGILGQLGLALDHALGQFFSQRADGALVRISTPLAQVDELVTARSRLTTFATLLEQQLEPRWPTESPARVGEPRGRREGA